MMQKLDWLFKEPKQGMSLSEIKQRIIEYVKYKDYVSIVELKRYFGEQAEGNIALVHGMDENLILFSDMSQVMVKAFSELLYEKSIHMHQSSLLVYLCDGGALNIPIARRYPPSGFKKIHWLPVVFRIGDRCNDKHCPNNVVQKINKKGDQN